jgi:hypothetical protein
LEEPDSLAEEDSPEDEEPSETPDSPLVLDPSVDVELVVDSWAADELEAPAADDAALTAAARFLALARSAGSCPEASCT